jgi:hypothetical protein
MFILIFLVATGGGYQPPVVAGRTDVPVRSTGEWRRREKAWQRKEMSACPFCGQPANSKEHVWPKWLGNYRAFTELKIGRSSNNK